jgi:5-methyltetrahydropteroyltriglutamate--homocysteine methyltransferase
MNTHFRAEHLGSLLRPPELLAARSARAAGEITIEDLRAQEDRAILAALDKQRAIGIDIFSDGEMRRGSWLTDMADAVDGFVSEKVTLD